MTYSCVHIHGEPLTLFFASTLSNLPHAKSIANISIGARSSLKVLFQSRVFISRFLIQRHIPKEIYSITDQAIVDHRKVANICQELAHILWLEKRTFFLELMIQIDWNESNVSDALQYVCTYIWNTEKVVRGMWLALLLLYVHLLLGLLPSSVNHFHNTTLTLEPTDFLSGARDWQNLGPLMGTYKQELREKRVRS